MHKPSHRVSAASVWGVVGFSLLLTQAIIRLAPIALEPIRLGKLSLWHWGLYAMSILFMAYSEGYKAFQLQVAPRVSARAVALSDSQIGWHKVLAPLFCMALFHSTRKRLITSWIVYAGIVVLIVLVRQTPQPYRGILDAGVVVGLSWGIVAIWIEFIRVAKGKIPVDPELP